MKAIWIERGDLGPQPRTHNLNALVDGLGLPVDQTSRSFLQTLSRLYVPTRYGEFEVEYNQEQAIYYLATTRAVFEWLLQQLSSTQ